MAQRTIVGGGDISWNMEFPPRENAEFYDEEDIENEGRPLTLREWQRVVLPGRNFTIVYNLTPYREERARILYETDGQPVTLLDLLTSIYEFYQEPLSQQEVARYKQEGYIPEDYDEPINKRIDALIGKTFFVSLDKEGNNVYEIYNE